jgi:cell division septation protein DedD
VRRFDLSKPAVAGGDGEEPRLEEKGSTPSKARLLFLVVLLVTVAVFGARHLIGRYTERGRDVTVGGAEPVARPEARRSPEPPPHAATAPPAPPRDGPPRAEEAEPAREAGPTPSSQPHAGNGNGVGAASRVAPRQADAPPGGWFRVQVGAMAREANARALKERLERLGYASTIRQHRGSITHHVVLVGTPGDWSEAAALTERLKIEGMTASPVEAYGQYRVEAGQSLHLDEAIDLARDLQNKGFTTRIAAETTATTLFLVRVGKFGSRDEARQVARRLREKGFPIYLVRD